MAEARKTNNRRQAPTAKARPRRENAKGLLEGERFRLLVEGIKDQTVALDT